MQDITSNRIIVVDVDLRDLQSKVRYLLVAQRGATGNRGMISESESHVGCVRFR